MKLSGWGANQRKTLLLQGYKGLGDAEGKAGEQQRDKELRGGIEDLIQRNRVLAERTLVIRLGKNPMRVPGL